MRYYCYCEPTSETDSTPVVYTFSEEDILNTYWDWWFCRMVLLGRDHLISRENCLEDWVTGNMAWETDSLGFHQLSLPF